MTSAAVPAELREMYPILRWGGAAQRTYVLPDYQVMFVSVAKNACTSVKWLLAEVNGEDLASFRPGIRPVINQADAIHQRNNWKRTPRLGHLTTQERIAIHPDNGWFVFGITRDPRSRLFSAWQNKLLMRNVVYRKFRHEPWFPPRRSSFTAQAVVDDFRLFVDRLAVEPDLLPMDSHFRAQTRLLATQMVSYTRVYEIRELGAMVADLERHLRAHGYDGKPLQLARFNDTVLRANAAAFPPDILGKVEQIYATDFETFGDRWDFERITRVPDWSQDSLDALPLMIDLSDRFGEVRSVAVRATRRNERLSKRLSQQRATNVRLRSELTARGPSRLSRVRRRLRGILRRRLALGRRTVLRPVPPPDQLPPLPEPVVPRKG